MNQPFHVVRLLQPTIAKRRRGNNMTIVHDLAYALVHGAGRWYAVEISNLSHRARARGCCLVVIRSKILQNPQGYLTN